MKIKGRVQKTPKITLTTGPVVRNFAAKRLVVIILNTTDSNYEVKVAVNDLTAGRKPYTENSLLIKGNFTESLTLPKPPVLYEVLVQNIPPGVFIWTSTSTNVYETYLIESNTFRHKDFMTISS
jgi:hypothetical protein